MFVFEEVFASSTLFYVGCREYDELKLRREKLKENRKKLVRKLGPKPLTFNLNNLPFITFKLSYLCAGCLLPEKDKCGSKERVSLHVNH